MSPSEDRGSPWNISMGGKALHRPGVCWTSISVLLQRQRRRERCDKISVSSPKPDLDLGVLCEPYKAFSPANHLHSPLSTRQEFPSKGSCQSQGVVITLCYHIHKASAEAALPPSEPGHGVAKKEHLQPTAQLCYFIPSLCCSFVFLQGCDGSMQENFCIPSWFGKQTSAVHSGGRKARFSSALAVTQQAQP